MKRAENIMAKRIDSLKSGDEVTLKVHPSASNDGYEFTTIFSHIEGSGETREAVFADTLMNPGFRLYRFKGRWSIASDARKVTLLSIN